MDDRFDIVGDFGVPVVPRITTHVKPAHSAVVQQGNVQQIEMFGRQIVARDIDHLKIALGTAQDGAQCLHRHVTRVIRANM